MRLKKEVHNQGDDLENWFQIPPAFCTLAA
jgi:hypothetical protein